MRASGGWILVVHTPAQADPLNATILSMLAALGPADRTQTPMQPSQEDTKLPPFVVPKWLFLVHA
jgi:hypothetical protein